MKQEKITVWVTKYALSSGITKETGEVCGDISSDMIAYGANNAQCFAHGNDWHRTPEAAIAQAEKMRKAKIISLKKSIDKLERMTFKIEE